MPGDERRLEGIRGWLIFVGIGLLASPIIAGLEISKAFGPFLTNPDLWPAMWEAITNPGAKAYHPLLAPLLVYEVSGNIAILIANIVLIYLFFRKTSILPKAAIIFLLGRILFFGIDEVMRHLIPLFSQFATVAKPSALIRAILTACIWVPYFIRSKRVKNTFVN